MEQKVNVALGIGYRVVNLACYGLLVVLYIKAVWGFLKFSLSNICTNIYSPI